MAKFVREIMNGELFAVEPDAPREDALDFILMLGISACPVIDEAGTLKGMVSIRDLMSESGGNRVRDRIAEPALTVAAGATIEEAARKLAEYQVHRLVAVDEKGRAVGMASAVDLVAALIGLPVAHPAGFPQIDTVAGLSWSADSVLDTEHTEQVPSEPGVLVLVYGGAGRVEVPVWVDDARDLRARVDSFVGSPQSDQPQLAHVLERDRGHLRFRFAVVGDDEQRASAVAALNAAADRVRRLG